MASQLTLLLLCLLFSKALSLTCHQCLPLISGGCHSVHITCPDKCLTTTASLYRSGTKVSEYIIQTCGMPDLCGNKSINLGEMKITYNSKCCRTDLCNREILSALPQQVSNGIKCYSCDAKGCSATVSCRGIEDHCVSASIQQGSNTVFLKGCVSKKLCFAFDSTSIPGISISDVQCCQGNLCNGAESFTLSFILMTIPLLSILFYYTMS